MSLLLRVLAPPHEALHLLALLLIGRRAVDFTLRHVDIPDDLSTGQYVFVAGLPAAAFILLMALGVLGLVLAQGWTQAALGLIAALFGVFGAAGTLGDVQLIAARLANEDTH
jgi:hypothetical protein